MKTKNLFWIAFLAFCSSCTMEDGNDGDLCQGWEAIYDQGLGCKRDQCNKAYVLAGRKGFCPDEYPVCTLTADKTTICRAKCTEPGQVLINERCLIESDAEKWTCNVEVDDNGNALNYCRECDTGKCPNGCKADGTCKVVEIECDTARCLNGCKADGSCKVVEIECDTGKCPNGCKADGTCKDVVNECDTGKCPIGCNADGSCKEEDKCEDISCVNGCVEGVCICLETCPGNCNEDGSCKEEDKCADKGCVNGCDDDGSCICPSTCENGCNEDGGCKEENNCPSTCPGNCNEDGSCKEEDKCADKGCENGCNEDGSCIVDNNNNHLNDLYETVSKQGKECRKHSDCDSASGKGDGFCDSFIGYKCSTKCTSDDQCVADDNYHFVCRGDGRCAPDTFETVWIVPGNDPTVTILLQNAQKCDFEIDWGDVIGCENGKCGLETIQSCEKDLTHTYLVGGTYHVKIKGELDGFHTATYVDAEGNNDVECSKLIEVVSFGPVGFGRTDNGKIVYGLANAPNLTKVSSVDIPDASKLTSLRAMFQKTKTIDDANITKWDVSNVTDFAWAFSAAEKFNQDISMWDTSKATDMSAMFYRAKAFYQPIGSWDVSNVTAMSSMFEGATSFNGDIGSWNVSKVTDMSYMFKDATVFNKNINTCEKKRYKRVCVECIERDGYEPHVCRCSTV